MASVGGAFAAGAVGELDVSLILYPAYYCVANGAMAILIHRRRAACCARLAAGEAGGPIDHGVREEPLSSAGAGRRA
jgi:hypothetical protein